MTLVTVAANKPTKPDVPKSRVAFPHSKFVSIDHVRRGMNLPQAQAAPIAISGVLRYASTQVVPALGQTTYAGTIRPVAPSFGSSP